ncbi:MAG TPA: peptidylprolyl isomerase [Longimicrobiales bacterium]|nr:peptidylprolyl isomerase [Longimicrobiales bacterium]
MPRFTLPVVLLLSATPLAAQQPSPEVPDRIVAVVGDSIILKSDVDLAWLQYQQQQQGKSVGDSAQVYRGILDNRVNELLIVQAALRDTSIHILDEQVSTLVQQELEARRRQFGGEDQFQTALRQSGMTLEDLRNMLAGDIRTRMLMREYIGKVSRDRKPPPVSDDDIKKYFEENREQFGQRPATISFTQVVIIPKASDSARATARAKLEEAMKELATGADFAVVARKYSDDPSTKERGGDLGWFRTGAMVREFDQMAFALQPGQVSPIIETSFGFHIIKLEKVRGAERQARHILVVPTVTADDAERMRSTADSIIAKLNAGANVDSIVRTIGDPNEQSRVGPFPLDRLPAPYNTVLNDVDLGMVVGPVVLQSATGASKFAVIKVTDKRAAGAYSLDDPQFRAQLQRSVSENRQVEEIIRDLRQRTLVEYRI